MIHPDVKPDNILLEATGRVLVADLGIASVVAGAGDCAAGTYGWWSAMGHNVAPAR